MESSKLYVIMVFDNNGNLYEEFFKRFTNDKDIQVYLRVLKRNYRPLKIVVTVNPA